MCLDSYNKKFPELYLVERAMGILERVPAKLPWYMRCPLLLLA